MSRCACAAFAAALLGCAAVGLADRAPVFGQAVPVFGPASPSLDVALLADRGFAVCPGEGSCTVSNGSPGCSDEACCNTVCANDSYCCDTAWDSVCANAANATCDLGGGGTCPGEGDCFASNGTPGCEEETCCSIVCVSDAYCCDIQWDGICVDAANELCSGGSGSCRPACSAPKQNVECLAGMPEYANRMPVGRILRFGSGWCTGWLVGAPNIAMTNQHCVAAGIGGLTIEFNFECDACENGSGKTTDTYDVVALLDSNEGLDYAILELSGRPADVWNTVSVDETAPVVGDAIYEIHHGEGDVKGYDSGNVTAINIPGDCNITPAVGVAVDAVATGGASGSPIFRSDNHCVTAICHCGPPCQPGYGIPMSAIMPLARPVIEAAGGVITDCGECVDSGTVGLTEFGEFADCMTGPGTCGPACATPLYSDPCCAIVDYDDDGDVDMSDASMFSRLFMP